MALIEPLFDSTELHWAAAILSDQFENIVGTRHLDGGRHCCFPLVSSSNSWRSLCVFSALEPCGEHAQESDRRNQDILSSTTRSACSLCRRPLLLLSIRPGTDP